MAQNVSLWRTLNGSDCAIHACTAVPQAWATHDRDGHAWPGDARTALGMTNNGTGQDA